MVPVRYSGVTGGCRDDPLLILRLAYLMRLANMHAVVGLWQQVALSELGYKTSPVLLLCR